MEALGAIIAVMAFHAIIIFGLVAWWAQEGGWFGVKKMSRAFSFIALAIMVTGAYLSVG